MKKKVFAIAVMFVMLATMLPVTAMAASANEKKLNKVTEETISTYDTALPTKGKKKSTKAKVNKLLSALPYKAKGSGTSWYTAQLNFTKENATGNYTYANKSKSYSLYKESAKTSYYYSENTPLIASYEGQNMKTQLSKSVSTSKKYTSYDWEKGAKTGTKYVHKVTDGGSTGSKDTRRNFYVYSNQKVLGETCMVYSYQYKGSNDTTYIWVSRKTGQTMKQVSVGEYSTRTYIYFERKRVSKPQSFYNAPKTVKFSTYNASAAEVAEALMQEEMLYEAFVA